MKKTVYSILLLILFLSCAGKKEILYLQDIDSLEVASVQYPASAIRPNDILSITVGAPVPETAIPYNIPIFYSSTGLSVELVRLMGYLVAQDGTITFPVLGKLEVSGKTTSEIEADIQRKLDRGGHLREPNVSVRLLNAKVSVLGEVKNPGTYTFTEQNLTLPQALGLAGDLTINGQRDDVLLITEEQGTRKIVHLDLTRADWVDSPYYYIKPNDVIVVNPNTAKVMSAGVIGDAGIVLTIASLLLTTAVLIFK